MNSVRGTTHLLPSLLGRLEKQFCLFVVIARARAPLRNGWKSDRMDTNFLNPCKCRPKYALRSRWGYNKAQLLAYCTRGAILGGREKRSAGDGPIGLASFVAGGGAPGIVSYCADRRIKQRCTSIGQDRHMSSGSKLHGRVWR